LFFYSKFILLSLLDIGNWNPNFLVVARLPSCNIPRTLKHNNLVQNASSHVFITMNHAITKQGRHIWFSTQFSKQNLLLQVSNASHIYPCPHFICSKKNGRDVTVIATWCNIFVHDYNA
jgi:hypothetical protein